MTEQINDRPQQADFLPAGVLLLLFAALFALILTSGITGTNKLVLPAASVDTASLQPGRWTGTRFRAANNTPLPPMQILVDVGEDGAVSGVLSLYPTNVPESAAPLVATNGCNIEFDALPRDDDGTTGITGVFTSSTTAVIQLNITDCAVKFYGPVVLEGRISGQYHVSYNETATLTLLNPEEQVLTPLQMGIGVFSNYCSACHGIYGQGAPGIPTLDTPEIRARSDAELLEIINLGLEGGLMPAWGEILSEEQKAGVLLVLRDPSVLR